MITPEQLAKAGTEHAHQTALFCWCNINKHRHEALDFMFAIPNGGLRDKVTASRLKAEGVRQGVPDIMLPYPKHCPINTNLINFCGLFIEMKRPQDKSKNLTKGRIDKEQERYILYLTRVGYKVVVCYGYEHAIAEIEKYLNL